MTALEWLRKYKLIAIVRGQRPDSMLSLSNALFAGGFRMMEITFAQNKPDTWKDTASAISTVANHMSGKMRIGAGTVLTEEQLTLARDAGAEYIITPNTNPALIRKVKELDLLSFPGAMTPSEIVSAWNAGADIVKVFPAGNLGPAYIKAVRAPLSHIPLMAVGGVNEKNAADFIAAGCCGLGIGGNLVNADWINAGQWDRITALAAEYVKAVPPTA